MKLFILCNLNLKHLSFLLFSLKKIKISLPTKKYMSKYHSSLKKLNELSKNRAITIIRWYQKWISSPSGLLASLGIKKGPVCVFFPTCSEYAVGAIEKYGVFYGSLRALYRISRCHPWQKNHFDPVK
jgi:putative membrane protein insertion efficiency factor